MIPRRRENASKGNARAVRQGIAAALAGAVACGGLACQGLEAGPIAPRDWSGAPLDGPQGPLAVGSTYLDHDGWIEFKVGDAPLAIVAPHGGTLIPAGLPERACSDCVVANDLGTQELARAVVDAFARRTGATPHLIVNRLHRSRFDGNRDLDEATGGASALEHSWRFLQASIDSAAGRIASRSSSRGLVIDLHGHGHTIPRLELGYLLSAQALRRSDAELEASGDLPRSSIARVMAHARSGDGPAVLLRGVNSLGGLLAAAGYASVPSPATPAPALGEAYFDGGFNTARAAAGGVDAIQIETHYTGVRDTPASRAAFADALALALERYLERHYGWRGPAATPATPARARGA